MPPQHNRPLYAMAALALASGVILLSRPPRTATQMTVWVFADSHARMLRDGQRPTLLERFTHRTGRTASVDLIASRALDMRLLSLFNAPDPDAMVPDLAEVEIGGVGKFLHPPVDQIGFLPLNDYLNRSGWAERIVPARLAPWTKQGVVFGIPHDVHPVTLTYRKDLFDEAGIDLAAATTWSDFHDACLRFQHYWQRRGHSQRFAIELPAASADYLVVMLLQRGVNLLDDHNRVHLDDPKVASTLAFYARLVAGPRRIGANPTPGAGLWTRDLASGERCAMFTPDWRIDYLRTYAPQLAGKLAMMPLPRFDPGDAPTSTWGGTMIGIPRRCKNPDAAWNLLVHLYLSDEALRARRHLSHIIPPVTDAWDHADYHRPDPFFAGQRIDALYVELAGHIPPRYVTPFSAWATAHLSAVLTRAVRHVQAGDEDLEQACARWLAQAADDLRHRIAFARVDR